MTGSEVNIGDEEERKPALPETKPGHRENTDNLGS
jgi:hypothetical protein